MTCTPFAQGGGGIAEPSPCAHANDNDNDNDNDDDDDNNDNNINNKNHYIFSSQLRADHMPGPPRKGQLMCTPFLSLR